MRAFVAVLMALALAGIGLGMLRSLRRTPGNIPFDEPEPASPDVRVTFRCETCGTEVLLLRRGSEVPPRHCGEKMLRRDEILRS